MTKKKQLLSAILIFLTLNLTIMLSECKSMYGIGMRVIGDNLLLRDVLSAPSLSRRPQNQTISFNYSISEPITYIEITSENNVKADVNFSYQDDLVEGSVTSMDTLIFDVTISIYGFDATMLGVNPSLILNKDSNFGGSLEPSNEEMYSEEDADIDDDVDIDAGDNGENNNNYEYDDDGQQDNVLRIGERQIGDYKIHESFEVSTKTEEPSNHTVVFYYIDDKVITSAEFTVFDSLPTNHPVVEYSYLSPHSLKATISDAKVTSLFVQLKLYGYEPDDLPVGFNSMLPTNLGSLPLLELKSVDKKMKSHDNEICPNGADSMSKSLSTGMAGVVFVATIFMPLICSFCL